MSTRSRGLVSEQQCIDLVRGIFPETGAPGPRSEAGQLSTRLLTTLVKWHVNPNVVLRVVGRQLRARFGEDSDVYWAWERKTR